MSSKSQNGRGFLKDPNPAADPAERYKMFGQIVPFELVPGGAPDGGNLTLALGTSTSPDGIHWAPNVSIAKMVNAAYVQIHPKKQNNNNNNNVHFGLSSRHLPVRAVFCLAIHTLGGVSGAPFLRIVDIVR